MSTPIIYGPPQSSYVRSARMTLEEKGVAYDLVSVRPNGDEILALHPWGKVPVLRHGDVTIYETSAIMRYADQVFDGPSLIPDGAEARAKMETWISCVNCYFYDAAVRNYILQYLFPRGEDGQPDRATIDAAVPEIKRGFGALDGLIGDGDFVAGSFSLADILAAPIMSYLTQFPEAKELMGQYESFQRAGAQIEVMDSFKKTAPPAPGQ